MSEDQEVEEIQELATAMTEKPAHLKKRARRADMTEATPTAEDESKGTGDFEHWSIRGKLFLPTSKIVKRLTPGLYEIGSSMELGLYFEPITLTTQKLLRFKDANIDTVLEDITTFWEKEDHFRRFSFPHKRGILLWGPPGMGKTCTTILAMEDVINRGGVVLKFQSPEIFLLGLRALRAIQPETPVVVIMEDLDEILKRQDEGLITNIMDGADEMHRIVFLATTNYPSELGPRIINRPSRFDRVIKINALSPENRELYLEHLLSKGGEELDFIEDLDMWIDDTEGLSTAHIKELFTSVIIFGNEYDPTIARLCAMKDQMSEQEGNMGLHPSAMASQGVSGRKGKMGSKKIAHRGIKG
jgi:hypothetical protein